jgi:hypothetical protein
VANSRGQVEEPAGRRSSQPPDAPRPLGTRSPLHGPGLAKHCKPGATRLHPSTPTEADDMERSGTEHEGIAGQSGSLPDAGRHDMAILGPSRAQCESAIRQESKAACAVPHGPVSTANVLRLLEGQRYRCALTGRPLTPDSASLDHIVPVRCGGEHVVENTQVLHRGVNRAKSTMTNEEFLQLCREVVRHIDAQPDGQPSIELSAFRPRRQGNESQLIDWFAEGQAIVVEFEDTVVTIHYVGRKGRRARIAISGPAGVVFRSLGASKLLVSTDANGTSTFHCPQGNQHS